MIRKHRLSIAAAPSGAVCFYGVRGNVERRLVERLESASTALTIRSSGGALFQKNEAFWSGGLFQRRLGVALDALHHRTQAVGALRRQMLVETERLQRRLGIDLLDLAGGLS